MNCDTLKHLQGIIENANQSKRIVTAPQEPPHVYYVVNNDGEMDRTIAAEPLANDKASDLDTIVRVVKEANNPLEIWYSRASVIGLDGVGHYNRVTMPLKESPQLAQLIAWDARQRVNVGQRELVMLLRTTFAGCLPSHPTFLENVRKLRTSKAAEVNSEIGKGKVSLGRSVIAEMSGVELIPEEITIRVPVFAAASLLAFADVRVCVDPNPEEEQFTLVVIPGQIEQAWRAGEVYIQAKLAALLGNESEIPLYHGTP